MNKVMFLEEIITISRFREISCISISQKLKIEKNTLFVMTHMQHEDNYLMIK